MNPYENVALSSFFFSGFSNQNPSPSLIFELFWLWICNNNVFVIFIEIPSFLNNNFLVFSSKSRSIAPVVGNFTEEEANGNTVPQDTIEYPLQRDEVHTQNAKGDRNQQIPSSKWWFHWILPLFPIEGDEVYREIYWLSMRFFSTDFVVDRW